MRNTLLSRQLTNTNTNTNNARARSPSPIETSPHPTSTIRLVTTTPSAAGSSTDANHHHHQANLSGESSWVMPSPIAAKIMSPTSTTESEQHPRKRVVLKKSKLNLLGGGGKGGKNDFSDVVRRVGGSASAADARGGYEIYVDQMDDSELGDIVMVKKKKSRVGLDGMAWGTSGEVINVPSTTTQQVEKENVALLKMKGDDKEKWWSIGRGRKDSKEKERAKEKENSKVKTPALPVESRARFNSFDSGALLNPTIVPMPDSPESPTSSSGLPVLPGAASGKDSVAIRAMRSVRSLARMGSWAQLKNTGEEPSAPTITTKSRSKSKNEGDAPKRKKKTTKKAEAHRSSGSSFEAGHLSVSPDVTRSLGKKKRSILGLELPSTMRLPTSRSGSTASSLGGYGAPISNGKLSLSPGTVLEGASTARDRLPSTLSNTSSRPLSTSSGESAASAGSGASVRWDEEGLETVKERRKREREIKSKKEGQGEDGEKGIVSSKSSSTKTKESRKHLDGRKRTPLTAVFPEVTAAATGGPASARIPILTIEEPTAEGHEAAMNLSPSGKSTTDTPVKKAHPRPVSEQLLGKGRPQGIYIEKTGDMSVLDAVTNDLAQLIKHLDLEATPGPSDRQHSPSRKLGRENRPSESPVRQRVLAMESPVKNSRGLRGNVPSTISLRPYAQARAGSAKSPPTAPQTSSAANMIGQPIAPWPTVDWSTSPPKAALKPITKPTTVSAFMSHKRTLTPAPAADPPPVFQPLRPAKKPSQHLLSLKASAPASAITTPPVNNASIRSTSSLTFGSQSTTKKSSEEDPSATPTPKPVFKKAQGHVRQRSSPVPMDLQNKQAPMDDRHKISGETKRVLGMSGTMGGSTASAYTPEELNPSDPDSDIPDELQVILSGESVHSVDDTLSYRPESTDGSPVSPSMHRPPVISLPSIAPLSFKSSPLPEASDFRTSVVDEENNHADIDEGGPSSEDDTKKSFDFTGELKKLNKSGGSDRRSFVEQLENAFSTPAEIEFRYDFDGVLDVEAPNARAMPTVNEMAGKEKSTLRSSTPHNYSLPMDARKVDPTVLPGSDSLAASENSRDEVSQESRNESKTSSSTGSQKSNGELKKDFKFGGRPSPPRPEQRHERPALTLSDIIPPPSLARALSTSSMIEDDGVLNSNLAKASEIPSVAPRMRLDSDSSSKQHARDLARASISHGHVKTSSNISFVGFESFAEVRRGFEFTDDRPAFYPPATASRRKHKRESLFSIDSVSSYGRVTNPGSTDPFDFAETRPPDSSQSEDDISMSMSVDDTFSFIRRDPRDPSRQRVDSDASSFYFRAPRQSHPHMMQPYNRSHRHHDSNFSVGSIAPPVSLHNRNYVAHRRNDSNTSVSSMVAMHGTGSGRAAWAKHRQDASFDSVMSDFSGRRLGRPGLGDKMLESALDYGMPLASISGSPPESAANQPQADRTSYDSIMDDGGRRSFADYEDDSLFDKTGNGSSVSSGSVFGYDDFHPPQGRLLPPNQFRPLSMFSIASVHSPHQEDDTMISMLGGGHVRRQSVASVIEASPCVRVEKRKHSAFEAPQQRKSIHNSPNEACIVEKPSIASSYKFGGERMIKAQRGLYERQSLEDSCLVADGEDLSASLRVQPVFSRPGPASHSRSSTCTSISGADTPPLSVEEGSSQSDGSQSSIDLSHVNVMLANTAHAVSTTALDRARARARGHGHRRRVSTARASRTSMYETIEEEMTSTSSLPDSPLSVLSQKSSVHDLTHGQSSIFVVESDTADLDSPSTWDDENGITQLRRYYTLREEAEDTVTDSKRVWLDTPFSIYAIQSFVPPRHPAGMQALLQHSLENYGPLPPELRRIRSRTQSRPSPYPQTRAIKASISPDQIRPSMIDTRSFVSARTPARTPALQQVSINQNVNFPVHPFAAQDGLKSGSPFVPELDDSKLVKTFGLPPTTRPRVPSTTRKTALSWSKRSTGKNDNKENNYSQGLIMTPSESLRLNRPRPRGRPTPGSARPIRV